MTVRNFSPAPTETVNAPQPLSPGVHIQPGFDVLELLPVASQDRLRQLRQRSLDAHAIVPEFEQIRAASMAKIEAANALQRLTDPPQSGGFNLPLENASVVQAQRTLDKATDAFKRLQELQVVRTAAWQSASAALSNVENWLKSGKPGGTALEALEIELPKLNKGEDILSALDRLRRRGRELKADLARIAAAPFPSSHAKKRARDQIEQLAQRGGPDVGTLIEHDGKIEFATMRQQSEVHGAERTLAFHQAPDVVGLLAWLHRDALIKRLDALIDAESDDAAAMTLEARQQRDAEVQSDLLDCEMQEAALTWRAIEERLPVEFRPECAPQAILGCRLTVAPRAANGRSTTPDVFDLIQPGR
jgi:hypothetical protein